MASNSQPLLPGRVWKMLLRGSTAEDVLRVYSGRRNMEAQSYIRSIESAVKMWNVIQEGPSDRFPFEDLANRILLALPTNQALLSVILKLDITRADVSVMSKDQVFSGLHQEYVEGAFKGILERHQLLSADGMTKRILISGSSYGALAVIACHCPSLEFVPMKSGLFKNLHFLTNKIEALLQEREQRW
ncbi:MAG: hypothetical protein MMC23_004871 [Stictis urceolatum]|nr:hypothetical protein [Stictis urceolata]